MFFVGGLRKKRSKSIQAEARRVIQSPTMLVECEDL